MRNASEWISAWTAWGNSKRLPATMLVTLIADGPKIAAMLRSVEVEQIAMQLRQLPLSRDRVIAAHAVDLLLSRIAFHR